MGVWQPPRISAQVKMATEGLRRPIGGVEPLSFIENELSLYERGIQTESLQGVLRGEAGDQHNTARGDFILVETYAANPTGARVRQNVLATDVGAADLYSVGQAATVQQPVAESIATAPLTTIVEGAEVVQDGTAGAEQIDLGPHTELTYEERVAHSEALTGGGGGAYGAMYAAQYQPLEYTTGDGTYTPVYEPPAYETYWAPEPVYYAPAPAYYAPAPTYYAPQPYYAPAPTPALIDYTTYEGYGPTNDGTFY